VAIIFHKWNCCQWLGRSRLLILSLFWLLCYGIVVAVFMPILFAFLSPLIVFPVQGYGGLGPRIAVTLLFAGYVPPHFEKCPRYSKGCRRSGGCEAQWKPRNLPSDEDLRHESRKNKRQIHEGHIKPSAPHYVTPTLRHPRRPMMDGQPAEPEPEPYPTSWPSPRSFM